MKNQTLDRALNMQQVCAKGCGLMRGLRVFFSSAATVLPAESGWLFMAGVVHRVRSTDPAESTEGDAIFLMNKRMFFQAVIFKSQPRSDYDQLKMHFSVFIISRWQK